MAFITNYLQEKAAGYLKTGLQAGGTLAGNAVGGVGSVIESGGRAFGEGTVAGGIKGVGGYINSYGDGVKNMTSADGPVSAAQKKVPVKASDSVSKASAAPKSLPSAGVKPKALPSTGGATKTLPAPSARSTASPKPSAQVSKPPSVNGAAKPPASNKLPNGKTRINPESRPKPTGGPVKPTGTAARPKPQSNAATGPKPLPDGKVRISAESRPKPAIKR